MNPVRKSIYKVKENNSLEETSVLVLSNGVNADSQDFINHKDSKHVLSEAEGTQRKKYFLVALLCLGGKNYLRLSAKICVQFFIAEVAELVDVLGSGSSVLTGVGVRIPSSAYIYLNVNLNGIVIPSSTGSPSHHFTSFLR